MGIPRLSRGRFLGTATLAAAAGPALAQPALLPIRIGAAPTDSFAEAYYARAMGVFERAGLAADVITLGNGAAIGAGIASGALDVGVSSVNTLANGAIHGVPFIYIAGGGMYDSNRPTIVLAVAKDSTVTDPRAFEGSSIAITGIKDVTHLAASAYLVQNGVDLSKIRFIEMPMPEMGPAMQRGTIAAGIVAEPEPERGGRRDPHLRESLRCDRAPPDDLGVVRDVGLVRAQHAACEAVHRRDLRDGPLGEPQS